MTRAHPAPARWQGLAPAHDGPPASRPWPACARARSLGFLALLVAAMVGGPRAAEAQASFTVADLDWLAGAWVLESTGERLEEWWSPPAGNSMVGIFRWVRGGELWITELLSITEEAGEVLFRLRHFNADMTPWEADDDAFTYRLTDPAHGRVGFTILEPRPGRPTRFVFEALAEDSLLVRLEGEEDGRPTVQDFRYGRVR